MLVDFNTGSVGLSVSATRTFLRYIILCTFLVYPLCLQEFLKKEFSHENIYFWVACEKYRSLSSPTERATSAREIFERHLCLGALEPVNVDSHARQATQDGLTDAASTLFLQAQKQIFNLMKFDSYPRFLKSDLYKECLVRELSGQELPFPGGEGLDTGLQLHSTGESHKNNKVQPHSQMLL
jgi:regulator of G-protein signaling